MSTSTPVVEPSQRIRLSAGAMSLTLHLAATLAVAVLVGRPVRTAAPEPSRDVGIVLAQRGPHDTTSFFRESTDPAEQSLVDAAGAGTGTGASSEAVDGVGAAAGLPTAADAASLVLPAIALPGAATAVGPGDELLVPGIRLGGSARRPLLPGLGDEAILAEEAAERAARQAIGPPTRVSLFGAPAAVGRSFVFAIDRSGSMGGKGLNALVAARDELARGIAHLEPNHKFQIIAYNHDCRYYRTTRLIPADAEGKSGVPAFIDNLSAFGGTLHEMALRAALALEPDVVFLLTDGGDPPLGEIELNHIRKLADRRTAVNCCQYGRGPAPDGENFLMQVARQNRGTYTWVDMQSR